MQGLEELKIFHNDKRRIRYAAKRYNFENEDLCSGTKENFEFKLKVEGGFVLKQKNRIVGWGIAWQKQKWKKEPEFHVYVLPQYRRRGFGSIIVKKAKEAYPEHLYCPHDKVSSRFFIKNNCQKSSYWSWNY
jgi:ribosomal protein S18 acetylase RimI-like enzyme